MCGRQHPALVHEDTRALELEIMEEGDLPGMRVTSARGAGCLQVHARGVSRKQQSLNGWREVGEGSDLTRPGLGTGSVPSFI